ncbi:MAG: HAD family hydrolase [Clostridia bacterium]|nr:HAD family hydrolase [Clostridia bacterium]
MYKTILFDFDGTLFDTGEGVTKSVQYAARAFGFLADDLQALRCFVGPPLKDMFIEKYEVDDNTACAMVEKYRERYAGAGIRECAPYPGIMELVGRLRGLGKNVAVATGKPTVSANAILAAYGLEKCFDAVLGSEFNGTRSRKCEVISELLEKFGHEDVVMVGDRENDVIGAAVCNVPCIGVSYGYAEPGELEEAGAIRVVKDAGELGDILLGII